MKVIIASKERGQCSVCRRSIKRGDRYYDLQGLWVHVDCWERQHPTVKQTKIEHDSFVEAIERNAIKAKDIPSMIQKLNEIRGDNAFDDAEFVSKDFAIKEYEKRRR